MSSIRLPIDPGRTDHVQLWSQGRHSFRHSSHGCFDANCYEVRRIDEHTAKTFVLTHHYARCYPVAAHRYGLYLRDEPADVLGVAVFGIPTQPRVLTSIYPYLEPYSESLELSRFVLEGPRHGNDRAPANSERWFLARCLRDLHLTHGVRGIVAFTDPHPRQLTDRILFPGHIGTIYQASNAVFTGQSAPRKVWLLPDGTVLSPGAIQKVRQLEPGHQDVERRLTALGARPRARGISPACWLQIALLSTHARPTIHPGCYRYAIPTNSADRRELLHRVVSRPPDRPCEIGPAA